MRITLIRRVNKPVVDFLSKTGLKEEMVVSDSTSLYEKYSGLAKPMEVEGIWRAPRLQPFTKQQFDRAYPENYKRMRIGLPKPGTFAAKFIDPKFDAPSPLVWTFIAFSPLTFWLLVELKHIYFPSEDNNH